MDWPDPTPPRPLVKICGLRRVADARLALELGAAFLGLILTAKSPRTISLADAKDLLDDLRRDFPGLHAIGVFVDEPAPVIADAAEALGLFAVQVHGDPAAAIAAVGAPRVIPALSIRDAASLGPLRELQRAHGAVLADAYTKDRHGGTGQLFDHAHVQPAFAGGRVFLAGGLGPGNIADVIARLGTNHPYAFDLSSGVEESAGIKGEEKLRRFFAEFHRTAAP